MPISIHETQKNLFHKTIEDSGLEEEANINFISGRIMSINYIGLVILVIGLCFLVMSILQPEEFIIYKALKSRSQLCWGEENAAKWMIAYSVMMVVFGALLMFRVFGEQEKED